MCPYERFQRLPDEKRALLLQVARSEFAANGYEQASFNRIVKAAGVSKGAMYYYFADKNDLFATVVEEVMHTLAEELHPLQAPTDEEAFWESLIALLYDATERCMADPEMAALGRALYAPTAAGPGAALDRLQQRAMEWVEHALELGQQVGAIRDDVPRDLLASMVTGLLFGADRWVAERWNDFEGHEDEARTLEAQMLEMCRNLLRPPVQAEVSHGTN